VQRAEEALLVEVELADPQADQSPGLGDDGGVELIAGVAVAVAGARVEGAADAAEQPDGVGVLLLRTMKPARPPRRR
jgi:hypothetical protein